MADQQLGGGRIVPAARPVETFITPAQIQAAAPARPQGLVLSNGSPQLVQTSGRPNVPGYNPGAQLGEAMQRFGVSLTKTLESGIVLYGSEEYQKGQNEVARAQMLVERQVEQSAADYGTANRQLAQRDPIGAMAMDQTNPFRHAGRQSALSQLAAAEIPRAMTTLYQSRSGDLALKDPTDPAINQLKADAISQVVQRYGLDESSPGFLRHFIPAQNRAWEQVTAQQIQDRNAYLKDTVWRTAGTSLAARFRVGREKGEDLSQVAQLAGRTLDEEAARLGLPGEATEMKQRAIELARQTLLAAGEVDAARAMGAIPVGPPDGEGIRATASQMFALEIMEGDDRYGEIRRRQKERELEPLKNELSDRIAQIGLTVEDGPEKAQQMEDVLDDRRYRAIPLADRLEIAGKVNRLGEDVMSQGFDPSAGGNFIATLDQRFGYGSQRDLQAADAALEQALAQTPQEDRARVRQQYNDWRNQQQKQPWELINPAITSKIKANLEREYPGLDTAAVRQMGNIEQVLAWGDATSKVSAQRQLEAYRTHVLTRLDEARTKKGAELSGPEAQQVISKALTEYGSKDPKQNDYLFPKVQGPGGTPSGGGGGGAAKPPQAPAGTKPSPVVGAKDASALDNLPDRDARLKNWGAQPLLDTNATAALTGSVLNGGSFPASFRRAARDAGTTPEQLLLRQVQFYPQGIQLTPAQRNQILKQGHQSQALNDNRQARNATSSNLIARSAGWMFDAVMGVSPAAAASRNPYQINLGGGYQGGGGQWNSGPAIAASHAETGAGYTLPGAKDANGRPVVLSRGGANSLAAMVRDSGGQVRFSDIASAQRSKGKNAAVGGVAGSEHLGGNALDIHGTSIAWIRKHGAKYGWYVNDYSGSHGGHVEFRGGGTAQPSATTRRGGGMTGLATYYTGSGGSDGVAGGPTANGERYDPNKMTAAVQWSLRGKYMNKWVTVEDMDTGKTVKVWVNDVGQMGGSERSVNRQDPRVIDLSPAAFKKLFGSTNRGVGRIRIVSATS